MSDDLLAEPAVASFAHPGANTTGSSIVATELDCKRQEILLEAVPLARPLAVLIDLSVTHQKQLEQLTEAGGAMALASRLIECMMPPKMTTDRPQCFC